MKATINDPGLISILEDQLRAANMSWLQILPKRDQYVFDHVFAIYTSSLCDGNGAVFDAWIVSGGYNGEGPFPFGGIYNLENFPTEEDALAAHIGRLVLDGNLKLLPQSDGKPKPRKRNSSM